MSKFLDTVSIIGAFVMAATPLLAVTSVAHAAESEAQPVHVVVGDLNFASPQDIAVFNKRAAKAAYTVCSRVSQSDFMETNSCRQAVRDEIVQKLGTSQLQSLRATPASWKPQQVAAR